MNKLERSFLPFTLTEFRAEQEGDKKFISGYAAVYNQPTDKMGFREVIKPGAFSRALKEKQDVRALINHNPDLMLGRSKSGTLQLSEDHRGLKFRVEMPATSYAADAMECIQRGDLDQCSFGFRAVKQAWVDEKDPETGLPRATRELHDVDLSDISAVVFPAYDGTSVKARDFSAAELRSVFPEGIPADVAEHVEELRGEPTKSVGGEEVPRSKFAYVGDPEKTETWKLPIHDKSHAANALARFNQTEGIPAGEKPAVLARIKAAAKKFGIDVSEDNAAHGPGEEELLRRLELANLGLLD